ncbi:protease inhibitor I42 family protein [Methanorbis rubei]|uniref:Proteinase inhibitor I42 chagasin domain-containing protein n=1 Tax=Methanorbis rubei TaxID=3028300 RepID=A0AAE4SD30_9EURY|nr:hypothetical protein [Methanocorpusculaceae archaeon Cs1]
MRQSGIVLLVLVVVAACVLAAGCIGTDNSTVTPTPTPTPSVEPVTVITVDKFGTAIPANDMIRFILPSNPTTGYQWITKNVSGLVINQTYEATPVAEGIVGSGGVEIFTITADKAGTYEFTAEYKRSWENETPAATFIQYLVYVDATDTPADIPMLSVVFVGDVNPKAGEVVKVITEGNPTTGYEWTITNDTQLKVLNSTFATSAIPGSTMVGVGGFYEWLVTADKAGTYEFAAEYKRSWEDEPVGKFFFDITFV